MNSLRRRMFTSPGLGQYQDRNVALRKLPNHSLDRTHAGAHPFDKGESRRRRKGCLALSALSTRQ